MRTFGIALTIISSILLILNIAFGVIGSYKYEKEISSYWELADKASTIPKKAEYIDEFVKNIELYNFKDKYNAIILTTPNNSFNLNYEALKSLQLRLHEISSMDVTSFQYQTAIQQITQQEQGEAEEMLKVFKGIWWKDHYFMLWNWIGYLQFILVCAGIIVGGFIWDNNNY